MLYYDFHIHSCLSPCGDKDMTPNNIVNVAKLEGLDVIAVSDHNTIRNVEAAMKVGETSNIRVIPGMEVETAEEVHILTLYPDLKSAKYAAEIVYDALPSVKNRPEIFGEQIIMNENDESVGIEEKLLISPTTLTIEKLFDVVESAGGLFVPAHVDRHSYSVLTNLGFIPDNLDIKNVEVSKKVDDIKAYLNNRKELKEYGIFRNSDAHYLWDISIKEAFLNIQSIEEIFKRGDLK